MKKLVVLSGAGVSAESGISTFRDSDGLWENYRVEDVASIEGWYRDPQLVLDFYNQRRRDVQKREPNQAHKIIAELERYFDVTVVTQHIDNLHERAGSSKIIHLHGEITRARGERDEEHSIEIGYRDILPGEKYKDGTRLRPFIVWFGESVPRLKEAAEAVSQADILIVIGTSLVVYPAAGLVNYTKPGCKIYVVDPKPIALSYLSAEQIVEKATVGMALLKERLLKEYLSK